MRPINFLAALITVFLFSSSLIASPPTETILPSSDEVNLKILSWNIYQLPHFVVPSKKAARAKALGAELSKDIYDYDVLVFQEAFKRRSRKQITRELEEKYPYRIGPANQKNITLKTNSGIWILSKYPILFHKELKFSKCATADDCWARKGALFVEIAKEGQRFQIIGTHLNAGGPIDVRYSQIDEIKTKLIEPFSIAGTPIFVCGDFNINKDNQTAYKYILNTLEAQDDPTTSELKYTVNGELNDLCWCKDCCSVIDYVFIQSNGLDMTAYEKKIPIITQPWSEKHEYLSDHMPVEVSYTFKKVGYEERMITSTPKESGGGESEGNKP